MRSPARVWLTVGPLALAVGGGALAVVLTSNHEENQGERKQHPVNVRRPMVRATADGCALHGVVGSTPVSGDGALPALPLPLPFDFAWPGGSAGGP